MYVTRRSPLRVVLIAVTTVMLGACGTPGGGRGGPPPGGGRSPGDSGGMACRTLVDQNRETFAQAAHLLALTPSQRILWEDYEQSVRVLIDESLRLEPHKGAHRSALAQIDDKVQAARQRVAQMERVATQATTFYLALDETQKRIADRNLPATIPDPNAGMVCLGGNAPGDGGRAGGGPGGPGGANGAPR